jgi:hypothetical protein
MHGLPAAGVQQRAAHLRRSAPLLTPEQREKLARMMELHGTSIAAAALAHTLYAVARSGVGGLRVTGTSAAPGPRKLG